MDKPPKPVCPTHACLFLVALALTVCARVCAADEWVRHDDKNHTRSLLNAYARATGLRPVSKSSTNLIRIWRLDVMGGYVLGYAAKAGQAVECKTEYDWKETGELVKRGHCRVITKSTKARDALGMLDALAQFNGREIDCGVMDGEAVYVEGVFQGNSFAFYSGNPLSCSDAVSKTVTKAIGYLVPMRQ